MLTGLANFRDVGGLHAGSDRVTRSGVLLRSECPSHATEADADYLVDVLGLRTIVDLREPDEVAKHGRGPLERRAVDYVHIPLSNVFSPTPANRPRYYTEILERHGAGIVGLIQRISLAGSVPVLIHCWLGQDRTGAVVALLLRLAGVSDQEICTEYALSCAAGPTIRARSRADRAALGLPDFDEALYDSWEPLASVMAETLARFDDRWGGTEGWAIAHDLAASDIAAWQAILTEPAKNSGAA